MFITYKQVKEFVQQAEPGEIVGRCGVPGECLIARAVLAKYSKVTRVSVGNDEDRGFLIKAGDSWYLEKVLTGDDEHKFRRLMEDFDDLGPYDRKVTREQALGIMEDADDYVEDIRKPAVSHHVAVSA